MSKPTQTPTRGRIVNYYPAASDKANDGNPDFCPAIIVGVHEPEKPGENDEEEKDYILDLVVFIKSLEHGPALYKPGVSHKNDRLKDANGWEWPILLAKEDLKVSDGIAKTIEDGHKATIEAIKQFTEVIEPMAKDIAELKKDKENNLTRLNEFITRVEKLEKAVPAT